MIFYSLLFILWTIFGSFSSVLIERIHQKKPWIMTGRSECPKCENTLSALELIPIVSYLLQKWKCRSCKTKIPLFYPLLELSFGVIFTLFWYGYLKLGFTLLDSEFIFWLLCTWVVGVYISYDLKYREIPDEIMLPAIFLVFVSLFIGYYNEDLSVFFDKDTYPTFHTLIIDHISSAILLYSFFFLQILIPGGSYLLKRKDFASFLRLLLSYFTLIFTELWQLVSHKKESPDKTDTRGLEIPTWIGGWDLRIALFTWLTLWSLHGITSFAFAYISGSIYGCFLLIMNSKRSKKGSSEIAFWPFLGMWWLFAIVFHQEIIDFLNNYSSNL